MSERSRRVIRHRSFAYLLLLTIAALAGVTAAVLLRFALQPVIDTVNGRGFWADFARGGLAMVPLAVAPLVLVLGRRLIKRSFVVQPDIRDVS